MDLSEATASGIASLKTHKLRSFLTMLGIIFGVGAVISMLSIGSGAERQALAMIDTMGVRNVLVQAKEFKEQEQAEIRKKSLGLSPRDADAITQAVPGVEKVIRKLVIQPYKVLSPLARARPRVLGVSADYGALMNMSLEEGRFFDARDETEFGQVCVIGPQVRRDLFGFEPVLGKVLKVNEVWLTVVGVLADSGVGTGRDFQGVRIAGTSNVV